MTMRSLEVLAGLSGRRALLAGGAGHIALAAGEALVELGARVAVMDIGRAACERRARELGRAGPGTAWALPCDVSSERSARQAVRRAVRAMGGLDIVVHCAAWTGATRASGWAVPFSHQSARAWEPALRVNVTSAFVLVQEARRALAASGRGSVVLFSSIYGLVGPDFGLYEGTSMANPAAYNAFKGGLLQLTRYLATALAPRVRVNAVSPGGVWRGQPTAFRRRYERRTPLGRLAVEEDLKGAVAYLASDLSAYVTGHNLVVDGGWTAW